MASNGHYHCSVKIIGRSAGCSAVAAAYRAGEKLHDERENKTHDYTNKGRDGVEFSAIFAPSHAPEWVHDRGQLWNETEKREDKSTSPQTAQLAREVEVSLPRELSLEQRIGLVSSFVNEKFVNRGMVADVNLHNNTDEHGNQYPHAHIMLSMRDISADGFGNKNREWNTAVFTKDDYIKDKSKLTTLRADWADYVNAALADSGSEKRVSHLSNEAQGLEPPKAQYLSREEYQIKEAGGYSYSTFNKIRSDYEPQKAALVAALTQPKTQKNLVYNHSLPLNDWEYIQARKAVEVDTEIYIEPPDYSHAENYINSRSNEMGLSR